MKTTTAIALVALQAASTLAWNSTCKEGVGPCVGPEVVALESSECQDYHIFLARGSDSAYPGHQGPLVKLICDGLGESCGYENIIYPANSSFAGPGMWCKSAHKGAVNGQKQMTEYAERCPDSKLILSGFSQGASVAQDILGGGGGPEAGGFDCEDQAVNEPLPRNEVPGSQIVAAVTFGAVVRAPGQNYTVDSTDKMNWAGESPRDFSGKGTRTEQSVAALNEYADIFREYCNIGDGVCAVGSANESLENHLNYFDLYNQEAADWVVKTAKGEDTTNNDGTVAKPSPSKSSPSESSPTKVPAAANAQSSSIGSSDADNTKADDQDAEGVGAIASAPMGLAVAVFTAALFQFL